MLSYVDQSNPSLANKVLAWDRALIWAYRTPMDLLVGSEGEMAGDGILRRKTTKIKIDVSF